MGGVHPGFINGATWASESGIVNVWSVRQMRALTPSLLCMDKRKQLKYKILDLSDKDGRAFIPLSESGCLEDESYDANLQLAYVLTQPYPSIPIEKSSSDQVRAINDQIDKWNDDDYFYRNHILSGMTDSFFDQYSKKSKTAKELWDTLKSMYQAEEASSKKFLVSNYMDFKMSDDRHVSVQVREFQLIANDICAAGMVLDENFHDLGEADVILGIKVIRSQHGIDSLMNLELEWFKELDKPLLPLRRKTYVSKTRTQALIPVVTKRNNYGAIY
ncbi:hypothetical protein RJ639_027280 [Escallonia herrerae]|uniref:Uncharacterized protein n=1 Tax=Escallonia herrerae TaxID=1293975 RepID=A0AA88X2Y5_9ASTE|nr:hypothetical protein RJ639_027280 [Escallonia herrerae]